MVYLVEIFCKVTHFFSIMQINRSFLLKYLFGTLYCITHFFVACYVSRTGCLVLAAVPASLWCPVRAISMSPFCIFPHFPLLPHVCGSVILFGVLLSFSARRSSGESIVFCARRFQRRVFLCSSSRHLIRLTFSLSVAYLQPLVAYSSISVAFMPCSFMSSLCLYYPASVFIIRHVMPLPK